jgi:hypothetical protein
MSEVKSVPRMMLRLLITGRKHRPRALQFSLRSLFAVMTLMCALAFYVSNEARIAGERKSLMTSKSEYIFFRRGVSFTGSASIGIPLIRRLFGDVPIIDVALPISTTERDRASVAELFPEARVWAYRPPLIEPGFWSGPHEELLAHPWNGQLFPFPDDGAAEKGR